ncbi:MAG TPA: AAA family ATPase [Candidatus Limnocylindrales bacterium]|nr:AAA family ATPase [Candidatus Limnocylindrales bacterium]
MPARLSSPILIGRVAEMAALENALDRAEAGSPVVVLVGGEAGIGKSRLVAEVADRARRRGELVLEGGCVSIGSEEGLPFAPIADALRGWLRSPDRGPLEAVIDPATRELGRLVPELIAGESDAVLAATPAEWAQSRLFDAFLILLERLGEQQAIVLIAEDLHWADRSTRDLLSFVARRLRAERVLVIGTYRSDELHRRHPLRPWLAEMERLAHVEQIELPRLEADEVAQLVAAIDDEQNVSPQLLDAVSRRSEGNPFFAEELVAAGAGAGELPARLRDVLLGRIGSLSEDARRLLAAASIAGGPVDHALLGTVLAYDDERLVGALEEAIGANLLVPAGADGTGYAFRHALLGEVVQDELLASERQRLHGAYARALAGRTTPDGAAGASHLSALAVHAAAAGDSALALRASIAAARASAATSAHFEAARAFERALALWDIVPEADRPADEDHVELLFETSGAFQTAIEPERAREAARAALAGVDRDREPLRAARLEERLAWATYLTGDLSDAIGLMQRLGDRVERMPPSIEGSGCLATLATFTLYAGSYREAALIAERAIAMSIASGASGRDIEAMGALGAALALEGDCERGLGILRAGLAKAKVLGDPIAIGMAYLGLASTLHDCDALAEAVETGLEGSEWARGSRYPGFDTMPVESLVPLGRWPEADAILSSVASESDEGSGALWNANFAAVIAVRSGRADDARALLGPARSATGLLSDAAFAGNLAGALIECALLDGRLDDARSAVDEALEWLARGDDVRFRARVLRLGVTVEAEIAGIARARRDAEAESRALSIGHARLERLRALLSGRNATSPVFAEARANLGLAEAEATRLVDRPDPTAWDAAADAFRSPRRPYELAWCRFRAAESMLMLRQPRNDVVAVLAEAWQLAVEIGALPLTETIERLARMARLALPAAEAPSVSDTEPISAEVELDADGEQVSDPFGLTAREREVLRLVAAGQTNRSIAASLFISESTASVHVSNIIGKLGVSNRVEAAAAAVRAGLAG